MNSQSASTLPVTQEAHNAVMNSSKINALFCMIEGLKGNLWVTRLDTEICKNVHKNGGTYCKLDMH